LSRFHPADLLECHLDQCTIVVEQVGEQPKEEG
jgi:hypothetical protein